MRALFHFSIFCALFALCPANAQGQDDAAPGAWLEGGFDLAEYRFDKGDNTFLIDGDASYGDDANRVVLKFAAGGSVGRQIDEIEAQLLYSRAIGSGFAVLAGVRHEFQPHPHLTYAVIGVEGEVGNGLALESMLFLSEEGDLLGELKAVYDLEVARSLVLQPRIQFGFAGQDVPEQELAKGITDTEVGVRLRYEFNEAFAPYVGVSHERLLGNTADFARANGDVVRATSFVIGFSSSF